MVKITRITTQKKNSGRYNIFIDKGQGEVFGFGLDEDILVTASLSKGQELTEEALQSLIEKDTAHKCFTLALNYLSYRMRSKKEIRDYLLKKEQEPEHIEEALGRLEDQGYIDDAQFAEAFVRTKVNTTSKGPLMIKKELIEKGIKDPLAGHALSYYSYETELAKATKLAETKLRSSSKKSQKEKAQQVQQNLLTKGFSSQAAKEAVQQAQPEMEPDTEYQALVYQGDKALRKYAKNSSGFELEQKIKTALYRKGFSMDLIQRYLDEEMQENAED